MSIQKHARSMTGVMTVVIFGTIAAGAWPNTPWLTYVAGGLAMLRVVVLIRQWP